MVVQAALRLEGELHHRRRLVRVVGPPSSRRADVVASLKRVAERVAVSETLEGATAEKEVNTVCTLVLVPESRVTGSLLDEVRDFRRGDRSSPLILVMQPARGTLHQLAALARAGLDELVLADHPTTYDELRRVVGRRMAHVLPEDLVHALVPRATPPAESICSWCHRHGFRPTHVDNVAGWFQLSRKTLHRWLAAANIPRLHRLISHGRLLHVAYHLDATAASVQAISRALGFTSPQSLGMLIKRETRVSPSGLRDSGAVEKVTQLIRAELDRYGTGCVFAAASLASLLGT